MSNCVRREPQLLKFGGGETHVFVRKTKTKLLLKYQSTNLIIKQIMIVCQRVIVDNYKIKKRDDKQDRISYLSPRFNFSLRSISARR